MDLESGVNMINWTKNDDHLYIGQGAIGIFSHIVALNYNDKIMFQLVIKSKRCGEFVYNEYVMDYCSDWQERYTKILISIIKQVTEM